MTLTFGSNRVTPCAPVNVPILLSARIPQPWRRRASTTASSDLSLYSVSNQGPGAGNILNPPLYLTLAKNINVVSEHVKSAFRFEEFWEISVTKLKRVLKLILNRIISLMKSLCFMRKIETGVENVSETGPKIQWQCRVSLLQEVVSSGYSIGIG